MQKVKKSGAANATKMYACVCVKYHVTPTRTAHKRNEEYERNAKRSMPPGPPQSNAMRGETDPAFRSEAKCRQPCFEVLACRHATAVYRPDAPKPTMQEEEEEGGGGIGRRKTSLHAKNAHAFFLFP